MYDIVIIGGGIAGLYTALNLNKNKKTILFEKNSYFGGRIYTDNFKINNNNYSLEAGSGRMLTTHKLMLQLINKMNLSSKLIKIDSKIDFKSSKSYSLTNHFSGKNGYFFVDKVIEKSKNLDSDLLKSITFKQLASRFLTKEELKFMLDSCGYYGDLVINNAYNALKVFKKSIRVDKEYYIMKGGFSQLINKMVDNIKKKHKLQLNKTCNSIFYNDDKFLLFIDGKPIYTKKLVLAIPQPNLFLIDFLKPYFPLFKSINCIRLTRIYSIYNKDDVWFHNIKKTTTNNHLKYIIPINKDNGSIMTSYTDYTNADYWSKIKNNKKILNQELNKNIENVFSIKPKSPIDIKVYDWECGVALWKPKYDSDILIPKINHLDKSLPLFIVGENFSKYQGWMEGALHSVNSCIDKLL